MKSHFERMGGTYRSEGDYFIPNLTVPPDMNQLGKCGRMHRRFLKEYHITLYNAMLLNGKLNKHLAEIDQICNKRITAIVSALAEQEGVTEQLKAADQMEWVRRMNSIHDRAEEIVLNELVYAP